MPSTGFKEFDDTIGKTNRLLKEIESQMGWENKRNQSYLALRVILHALRDLLLPQEAVQLGEQLPTLVRGVYYEAWQPGQTPKRLNRTQFLAGIRRKFPFSMEGSIEYLVGVVLRALRQYISEGEAEDIKSELSKDLRSMFGQFI